MKDKNRRLIMLIICTVICITVICAYLINNDSRYEEKSYAKDYILQNHTSQTGALNAVSAIYLNYRLWDTLFEAMILLLSALAVISFSWSHDHEE